jgi:hypothetical protein
LFDGFLWQISCLRFRVFSLTLVLIGHFRTRASKK